MGVAEVSTVFVGTGDGMDVWEGMIVGMEVGVPLGAHSTSSRVVSTEQITNNSDFVRFILLLQ